MKHKLFTTQRLETFPTVKSLLSVLSSTFTALPSTILCRLLLWAADVQRKTQTSQGSLSHLSLLTISTLYSHEGPIEWKELIRHLSKIKLDSYSSIRENLYVLQRDGYILVFRGVDSNDNFVQLTEKARNFITNLSKL